MNLQNRVALVTGASRGIGRAILIALAQEGMTVVGTATSDEGAQNITDYMKEQKFVGKGMKLLIHDEKSINETTKSITEQFAPISVLVNNAGITDDSLLMRMKDEQWHRVIDTNLSGVFRLSKSVLRDMMKAKMGRIINIASVVGIMGNAGQTNYAAAKAGIIGFSKSLAREVGSRGITVNTIAPGFIQTDMTNQLSEQQKQSLISHIPLAKLGTAEDVAHAVVFIAKSDYLTGETINVNGGMYMI